MGCVSVEWSFVCARGGQRWFAVGPTKHSAHRTHPHRRYTRPCSHDAAGIAGTKARATTSMTCSAQPRWWARTLSTASTGSSFGTARKPCSGGKTCTTSRTRPSLRTPCNTSQRAAVPTKFPPADQAVRCVGAATKVSLVSTLDGVVVVGSIQFNSIQLNLSRY